jgi:uncharacterized protein (TIGR04222 family)
LLRTGHFYLGKSGHYYLGTTSGCDEATNRQWNPLEFRGPKFLLFYAAAFVAACVWAIMVRADARDPSEVDSKPLELDAYDMAYLNGGAKLVVNTAIATLCQRGALAPRHDGTLRGPSASEGPPAVSMHRIERAVYELARSRGSVSSDTIRSRVEPSALEIGRRLKGAGLIVTDDVNLTAVWRSLMILMLVVVLGVVKMVVGLERGRPVGFLLLACLGSGVAGLAVFGRPLHRTRRGDLALDYLRTKYGLRNHPEAAPDTGVALAIGVALWGPSALIGEQFAKLRAALRSASESGSGWSSCGSSCGGGCGGGGCGGGCGGCGG